MRLLQINIDRRRVAHDLLLETAGRLKIDLILVQEPNKRASGNKTYIYMDRREDACIFKVNKNLKIVNYGNGNGFVWVQIDNVYIYSCYLSPNVNNDYADSFLQDLGRDMDGKGNNIVVGGDFNGKSPMWGSPTENARGEAIAEWINSRDLVVINEGEAPTFERGNSQSHIDITLATSHSAPGVIDWSVINEDSLSLHKYLTYEIRMEAGDKRNEGPQKIRKLNKGRLKAILGAEVNELNGEVSLQDLTRRMQVISKRATDYIRKDTRGNIPYWWNDQIAEARKETGRRRRQIARQRNKREQNNEVMERLIREYKDSKRELKKLILNEKRKCWATMCEEINKDVWGEGYRIMMDSLKLKKPKVELTDDRRMEVIRELFPPSIDEGLPTITWAEEVHEEITCEEVRMAADKLKNGKAPGRDGIPPEAAKELVNINTELVVKIFNEYYQKGEFPRTWKVARLVLIPKPGKDRISPTGYRPLCLIDTLGKMYEGVILKRLNRELMVNGGLNERQFGFREGRSTISALYRVMQEIKGGSPNDWRAFITIDVRNAFNSASWKCILEKLCERGVRAPLIRVIADYLKSRVIEHARGQEMETSRGVPQGSVLGPTLWNVLYDGVLDLDVPRGTTLIAYADDLAIVAKDGNLETLISKVNRTLERVDRWMGRQGLEIAPEKTEAMLIAGMRRPRNIEFHIRGTRIEPKRTIKYLGVVIDKGLTFSAHVEQVTAKAESTIAALARLMPNVGGPRQWKRQVMAQIINSILLYAAPVWSAALRIDKNKKKILATQRKIAIRVASAYRTVSAEAAMVIAGCIPVDLLIAERTEIYAGDGNPEAQKRARRNTIEAWQRRWEQGGKGQWTREMITNLDHWINRGHGQVNYQITQALTGHGNFKSYLKRIGKAEDDLCIYCRGVDNAEHTLFVCPRWENKRRTLIAEVGDINRENMIQKALIRQGYWDKIMGTINHIMTIKDQDLRRSQEGGGN